MGTDNRPQAVDSAVYSRELLAGMGGRGSNDLFIQSQGKILRPRLSYALDLARWRPGLKMLDLGCGRGELVLTCALRGAVLAAGLDYATGSLSQVHDNAIALGLPVNQPGSPLVLVQADAKSLPWPDNTFDRVFMLDIVEHLHDWELDQVWAEVKRVLAPNGYLIVHTLPNRWAIDFGYRLARLILRRLPRQAPDQRDLFHVNEQSPPSLIRSLSKAGFNNHVWLRDLMAAQARWATETRIDTEGPQEQVYGFLTRPIPRSIYNILTWLPFRLLFVTDLFALAWASGPGPEVLKDVPRALWERWATTLGCR